MRLTHLSFFFLFLLLISCSKNKENVLSKPTVKKDLKEHIDDGILKVSIVYNSTSYFLYRGETMGFEYELIQLFANYLGVEVEIKLADDINNLIPNLNNGKVDLIAYGLTITKKRQKQVSFSDYIYLTHQVLVQKKPDNWRKMKLHEIDRVLLRDAIELKNKSVSIRYKTAFTERLNNLSSEIGGEIEIDTLSGSLTIEEIVKMVSEGEIEYTISDANLANILAQQYKNIDVRVPVSLSQQIAWATRTNSPKLLKELNAWLKKFKKTADYHVIYNRYFKNNRSFRKRIKSEFLSLNSNIISKYDDLIKEKSNVLNWDWRLVSALIYQESQFEIHAKSWAGAGGLMQMMPATAKEMGVENRFDANDNITGGTNYLKILWKRFDDIPDAEQRIKFTMASYNCGYGHVLDAQRLADENDLNRNKWDENVDKMILSLSLQKNYNNPIIKYGYVRGIEPVTYVQQIFERYNHYKQFIKE